MNHLKYTIIIVACFLLAAFLYGNIDISKDAYADWDYHQYIKIAQAAPELDPSVERPFAFRFGVPYLIGLIPLNLHCSYIVLNYLAILILLVVFYRFLLFRNVPASFAFMAVFFYLFNKHFIGYNMWNPYQINDILMNLVILWFLYSMIERKYFSVVAALVIGSFLRETVLILIPTGFVYLILKDRRKAPIILFCAAAIVTALIPLVLRQTIPACGGDTLKEAFSINAIYKLHTIKGVYHYNFNPWIPFSLIPFVFFRETWKFMRENFYLVVLFIGTYFSGFFGENVERLLHPAYIVFYPLLIFIVMRRLDKRPGIILFLIIAFLSSFHHIIGRFPLPSRSATIVISGGGAIIVTLYAIWSKVKTDKLSLGSKANSLE